LPAYFWTASVDGSIPTREKGIYTKMAGRPAMDVLAEIGGQAAAIITYFFE
jgi:hydrogenase small subunit